MKTIILRKDDFVDQDSLKWFVETLGGDQTKDFDEITISAELLKTSHDQQ